MSNFNNNMQSNPFWDFVASMQDPRNINSQFPAGGPPRGPPQGEGFDPFQQGGWGGWGPFGQMPHRGRRHERGGPSEHDSDEQSGPSGRRHGPHGHGGARGPPPPGPPPPHHGEHPPPPPPFGGSDDKHMTPPFEGAPEDPPSRAPTPPTPSGEHRGPHGPGPHGPHGPGPQGHGPHGHGRHGHGPHGEGRRGGRCGMRGERRHDPHGGPGGHSHGHGPRGPGGPGGFGQFPFDLSSLIEAFAPGVLSGSNNAGAARDSNDDGNFRPDLDLFDTVEAYVLHLSLPGAKKSDISTTYSSVRNSITVSGVVTRPNVDEEMMNTLSIDERRAGAFEREIKLESGVKIDEDGISAKLEDGVLRVIVPKVLDEEDEEYIDVKRIELD